MEMVILPMEITDIKCPFCARYLTDVDGMLECQEGCGASDYWNETGPIPWFYKGDKWYVFNLFNWVEQMRQKSNIRT